MSKKSKPGDGTVHQGVKGGGLYDSTEPNSPTIASIRQRLRLLSKIRSQR